MIERIRGRLNELGKIIKGKITEESEGGEGGESKFFPMEEVDAGFAIDRKTGCVQLEVVRTGELGDPLPWRATPVRATITKYLQVKPDGSCRTIYARSDCWEGTTLSAIAEAMDKLEALSPKERKRLHDEYSKYLRTAAHIGLYPESPALREVFLAFEEKIWEAEFHRYIRYRPVKTYYRPAPVDPFAPLSAK